MAARKKEQAPWRYSRFTVLGEAGYNVILRSTGERIGHVHTNGDSGFWSAVHKSGSNAVLNECSREDAAKRLYRYNLEFVETKEFKEFLEDAGLYQHFSGSIREKLSDRTILYERTAHETPNRIRLIDFSSDKERIKAAIQASKMASPVMVERTNEILPKEHRITFAVSPEGPVFISRNCRFSSKDQLIGFILGEAELFKRAATTLESFRC